MSNNDKLFYKERPYIYAGLAVVALFFARNSNLALICGVILMICSYLVFEMRKQFREKQAILKRKQAEMAKRSEVNGRVVVDNK